MAPLITLYILGGCVAAAVLLFIVMSIVSAVRPPQLPDISLQPPPLQRMIRALTPLPVRFDDVPSMRKTPAPMMPAAPRSVPSSPPPVVTRTAPSSPPPVVTRTAPSPPPLARHAIPVAPAPPSPPVAAPRPAPPPPPVMRAAAPSQIPVPVVPSLRAHASVSAAPSRAAVVLPVVPPPFNVSVPATPGPHAQRPVSLPTYPARPKRKLVRFMLVLFLTSVVASGTIVAHPALLDAACDDYEWAGAGTARVVRERAYEVHYAIGDFIADLRARL